MSGLDFENIFPGEGNGPKVGVNIGNRGIGRPKGVPNKNTTLLKDALLAAAENAGGKAGMIGYLTAQATENPAAFMTLLGKVLPLQLVGDKEAPLMVVSWLKSEL